MHLCSCEIALGGDIRNTVVRGETDPVTYPEVALLRLVHGESSVTNVEVVGEVNRDPGEEKKRLATIYPVPAVETLFPGTKPPMETEDRNFKKPAAKKKAAPNKPVSEDKDTPFGDTTE